ncbi:hypothetical protein ACWGKS_16215 [Nocardiopsis sp. NPDC055879]
MTYLASADLLAVRSLAAESAFSLDHRVDLPVKRSALGGNVGGEGNRARTFDSGIDAAVLPAPRGRHHRPEPAPEPEPVDEDTGFTVIDLRDQDTGFRIRTEPDHQRGPGALAMVIELDAYRTPPGPPPTTPSPAEAGPVRRRGRRVRGYVRDLEPDERAEFATLRNTIRAYLRRPGRRAA